jgi:two-component sensor histidine kinase
VSTTAKSEDLMLPVDLLPFGVLIAERSSLNVRQGNLKAAELLGRRPADLAGASLAEICPEIQTVLEQTLSMEAELLLPGGEPRRFSLLTSTAADPGELLLWLRPPQSTESVLLREMKHRIKNDFLIVSSFIQMKSRELGDPTILADLRSRVDTIQAVHSRLSEKSDHRTIGIQAYLEEIVRSTCAAYYCGEIRVETSIEKAEFDSRKAVTLGLILNEIVVNSAKHAFPGGGTGEDKFWVSLSRSEDGGKRVWNLETGNSGPPIPDSEEPKGLGMRLIEALASELNGSFSLTRSPAPRYRIQFPG